MDNPITFQELFFIGLAILFGILFLAWTIESRHDKRFEDHE